MFKSPWKKPSGLRPVLSVRLRAVSPALRHWTDLGLGPCKDLSGPGHVGKPQLNEQAGFPEDLAPGPRPVVIHRDLLDVFTLARRGSDRLDARRAGTAVREAGRGWRRSPGQDSRAPGFPGRVGEGIPTGKCRCAVGARYPLPGGQNRLLCRRHGSPSAGASRASAAPAPCRPPICNRPSRGASSGFLRRAGARSPEPARAAHQKNTNTNNSQSQGPCEE